MTASAQAARPVLVHASCVALEGRGLLILGRAGAGKSSLALELIALGAGLVADDQVALTRRGAALVARAPAPLAGLIEARGIGLLRLPHAGFARLALAIDLDAPQDRARGPRLPPAAATRLLGATLPLLSRPEPLRAAAIAAALREGPPLDPDDGLDAGATPADSS